MAVFHFSISIPETMQVSDEALDVMQNKLKGIFETKSGFGDERVQSKLLEKHFKVCVKAHLCEISS